VSVCAEASPAAGESASAHAGGAEVEDAERPDVLPWALWQRWLRDALVEEILVSDASASELDRQLRQRGMSLRCIVREIPPVFGTFFQ
jgi:hypothetical protein